MLEPRKVSGAASVIAVVVTLLVLGNLIASGHAAATLDADIVVVEQHCEDGAVTALTLRAELNREGMQPVTPHVWSSRQHVQFTWDPSMTIIGDEPRTFRIEAPDDRAVIEGDRAQVYLAAGQQRVIENFEVRSCS